MRALPTRRLNLALWRVGKITPLPATIVAASGNFAHLQKNASAARHRRGMVAGSPRNRPQSDEIARLGNRGRAAVRRYA
jgi:hypothetical protein